MGRFTSIPITQIQGAWPTAFNKPVIGLELSGVIIEDINRPICSISQVKFIPGSLEAIKLLRLSGYKIVILTDQPDIYKGMQTTEQVETVNQYIMQEFGKYGILSIDGMFYSTTDLKQDEYAKPNIGMFRRAESENKSIKFNKGWFVGHNIKDLKAAEKIGAIPVLVYTGNGNQTAEKLQTYANKQLLSKTKIYTNLLDFARSLE